ncbi:MAG: putative glycolipid-binding domain-containing protein [Maritimibacter sp.]
MNATVAWTDWAGMGLERCTLDVQADGLSLEGVVIGTRGGDYGAHYRIETDAGFVTRDVWLRYIGGPELHVMSDGQGQWHDVLRDQPISALDGCFDVDIGVTPATNLLPIKRLKLADGANRDILAAYVPLPSQVEDAFLPRPAKQRYTCLSPDRAYRYEGLFRGFTADLEIDAHGLVLDYPETFRRVPS